MTWYLSPILLLTSTVTSVLSLKPELLPPRPSLPRIAAPVEPFADVAGTPLPPLNTTYYFDQWIDHNDHGLGTFKQRYWHTWEFYKPGGPIILSTPGVGNAEGFEAYLTNKTINGQIAQQEHGATVVIEHRFFGLSNSYPSLTDSSLHLLDIQQHINDVVYFTRNVTLPMPDGGNVKPDNTPWVLVGGAYAGALAAWTMTSRPGIYAAAYTSSAVVQAIADFWRYFEPIRQNMPANCSADLQAIITHVDEVLVGDDSSAINELKASFGLGDLTRLDDVAAALRNPLYLWLGMEPGSGSDSPVFQFCDAMEVKNGVSAPESGWGLEHALPAFGRYFKEQYIPSSCGNSGILDCFGSYDAEQPIFTNTSINNDYRSWMWLACNEVGWLQTAAPIGQPSLISRLVDADYDARLCSYMFPNTFPETPKVNVDKTNQKYQGWNTNVTRIFFANGQRDPWREATMSAETQNIPSTPQQVIETSNGIYCHDMDWGNGDLDPTIRVVQVKGLQWVGRWLEEWRSEHDITVGF